MLEVTIESIFNSVWGNDVDISTEPRNKKEPLLVVFSKQINKRLVHQQERDELLQHDMTLSDIEDVDNYTTTEPPLLSSTSSNGDQSDDEELEDDEDEDDSKEDSYGSIDEMTSYAKVTQSMRTGKEYQSRSKQKVRVKRSKTSSKRNICRRTKLEVDFRDIQGHGWIVAPKKYQVSIIHLCLNTVLNWIYFILLFLQGHEFETPIISFKDLKIWYLILPCLTFSIIRYVSRVKWRNLWERVPPSPIYQSSNYWKGSLRVALDYGRQVYFYY